MAGLRSAPVSPLRPLAFLMATRRAESWQQQRETPVGILGRPQFREWSTVLAEIALEFSDADADQLEQEFSAVRQAISLQRFVQVGYGRLLLS